MFLGINTGCLINRFIEPNDWCHFINKLNIENIQLTTSLVDLSLTGNLLERQVIKTKKLQMEIILK